MLKKDFEEDDPYALVGQGFPNPEGYDSAAEMARCFVEEFAMLGYPAGFTMTMFKTPMYQGPYGVFRAKGEAYVRDLIQEVYGDLTEGNPNHA